MKISYPSDILTYLLHNINLDKQSLVDLLKPHCKFNKLHMRGSRLRILQIPDELADFCVWMQDKNIKRYLEIGTSTGGSWMFISAYLASINPDFAASVGYDRTSKLRDFDTYKANWADTCKSATIEFRHQSSNDMNIDGEKYDLSYIDACHKRDAVWSDFNKVKDHSRFVAFHDIVLTGGSTVDQFWKEIKQQYKHWEFIDKSLPETCGIGVVEIGR